MDNQTPTDQKMLLAFVGMPGAGKSIAAEYIKGKDHPVVRFGDITDEKLHKLGWERNPKNEEKVRETIRQESGMAAYAVQSAPKIKELLEKNSIVVIDGLYSWEEYLFVKKEFPLILIHIFAEQAIRYERLAVRSIRPFTKEEARIRDVREIEHLSKGGPIAMADFMVDNDDSISRLHKKIDILLQRLHV